MKIYDCFTFYNEYELLELRLKTLNDIVDYFVICELDVTQNGKRKPFYFDVNKKRYEKYLNKIIHIKATNAPKLGFDKQKSSKDKTMMGDWSIENYQRNCIMKGLNRCEPDDLIMISDLDEIINPHVIENLYRIPVCFSINKSCSISKFIKGILYLLVFIPNKYYILKLLFNKVSAYEWLKYAPVSLQMDIFYYFLNCKSNGKWHAPIITMYKNMHMPQILRDIARSMPFVENGGWHLSYMGGKKKIKEKLCAIIEGNPNLAMDDNYIDDCLDKGIDIYGRKGKEFSYRFVNETEITIPNIHEFINKYPHLYRS